jgi:hypothetical protein
LDSLLKPQQRRSNHKDTNQKEKKKKTKKTKKLLFFFLLFGWTLNQKEKELPSCGHKSGTATTTTFVHPLERRRNVRVERERGASSHLTISPFLYGGCQPATQFQQHKHRVYRAGQDLLGNDRIIMDVRPPNQRLVSILIPTLITNPKHVRAIHTEKEKKRPQNYYRTKSQSLFLTTSSVARIKGKIKSFHPHFERAPNCLRVPWGGVYIIDVRGGGRRLLLYSYVTSSIVCSVFLFYFIIFILFFSRLPLFWPKEGKVKV